MPKPRERCLKEMATNRKILLWFYFSTYVILWKKGRRVSSLLLREQIKKKNLLQKKIIKNDSVKIFLL
jgi:hypothetical protein